MKALFLVGGTGTRLKPITDNLPKPMIPIFGSPLLEINIKKLKKYGIDEVILSTCYKPQKIERYFGNGKSIGVKVNYVFEEVPLGTAGAIKNAEKFIDDTFLVFNADILTRIDIANLIKFHEEKNAQVTIAATEVENPWSYGVIEHCDNKYITAFKEKPKPNETSSKLINAGIYVFEPEILDEIPEKTIVSVEKDTYPYLLENGFKMTVYNECSYWMDLGTPEKYMQVHADVLNGLLTLDEKVHNYRSKTSKISKNAQIINPVYIGDNVEIGDYAVIGPETVLCDNCCIGDETEVIKSIVWKDVKIDKKSVICNSIIMPDNIVDLSVCNLYKKR